VNAVRGLLVFPNKAAEGPPGVPPKKRNKEPPLRQLQERERVPFLFLLHNSTEKAMNRIERRWD
jgi:hypothetical protein